MDDIERNFTLAFETATLEGTRVELVGLKEFADYDAFFEKVLDSREFLEEHLPWVKETSASDLKKRVRSWVLSEQLSQGGCWQIFEKRPSPEIQNELQNLAGFIMMDVNLQNRSATLSYWLFENFSGRGLMTESLKLLEKFCFSTLHLNRLELFASVENPKSQAVAERSGFIQEGICRDFEIKNGIFIDHVRYSRLARD